MTTYIWDSFSGVASLSDITGRLADGGLEPGLSGVGTWTHVPATDVAIQIGTTKGIHGAVRDIGVQSAPDAHYRIADVTLPTDQTVQATAQFVLGGASAFFAVLLHQDATLLKGYELSMNRQGTVSLVRWDGATNPTLFTLFNYPVIQNTEYTLALYRTGSQVSGSLNGVPLFALVDTAVSGGAPGLCINNFSTTAQEVVVTDWRVTDDAPPVDATCAAAFPQAAYAQDGFDGVDTLSTDGRLLDGAGFDCLAQGRWREVEIRDPHHSIQSNRCRFWSAFPTSLWRHTVIKDIANLGDDYSVEVLFQVTDDPANADPDGAWTSALVRHSEETETGYEFLAAILAGGVGVGGVFFTLYKIENDVYTSLWDASVLTGVPAFNTDQILRLCVVGNRLCGFFNGQPIVSLTDSSFPSGGYPGLCIFDGQKSAILLVHEGKTLKVDKVRVVSAVSGAPGCGGPGGGGPPTPGAGFIWPMGQGAWRPVPGPSVTQMTRVQRYGKGAARGAKKAWAFAKGAWRLITVTDPTDGGEWNGDPGNTIADPGCGQVPAPTVTLDPIGARLFYCAELPLEGKTDPFDSSYWATGGWTPGDLAICQARGLRLITTQGGYNKFKTGGVYDPAKMDAWIASNAYLEPLLYPYFASGVYYGVQFFDDYRAANLWGISISGAEVNRVAGVWKTYFPWMRTILRDTAILATAHAPGETFSNVDVFLCAYVARWGAITPWIADNISIASGLGKRILWSMNVLNFRGVGSPMSAADILEFGGELAAQSYSDGLGIWKYDLAYLNGPGIVDALSTDRNIMVAVP